MMTAYFATQSLALWTFGIIEYRERSVTSILGNASVLREWVCEPVTDHYGNKIDREHRWTRRQRKQFILVVNLRRKKRCVATAITVKMIQLMLD